MAALAQCLIDTLNPDATTRVAAENRLSALFLDAATPIGLATICASPSEDVYLRQMTGVALGKYISERWSPFFSTFKGNPPPTKVKEQVRAIIFSGLSDPNRKIRATSAFAVSKIAHSDWPDHYESLLDDLINLLGTGQPQSIEGALQVFTEFARDDLTEDQLLPVLRQLLPTLLSILVQPGHDSFARARAVVVFRQCVTSLLMVKDQIPAAVTEASNVVLPLWLDAFRIVLESDPINDVRDTTDWSALAPRIQIFRTLNALHSVLPRLLTPYLPTFLSLTLAHLNSLLPVFHRHHVAEGATAPPVSTPDDPDQGISLPHFASSMIDLLSQAVSGGRVRSWFTDNDYESIGACVRVVAGWTQITDEDEESWSSNANAFIAEEDDETAIMSLRITGFDLLQNMLDAEPVRTAERLQAVTSLVVEESAKARHNAQPDWWKPMEAVLALLGAEAVTLVECIEQETSEGRPKPFQIESLLTDVVPSLLSISDCPFLQGRAFVFASNFATYLPASLGGQYLHAAVETLEAPSASIPVKVSAVKAIRNFCRRMENAELDSYAPRILADLTPFLASTSEDTLALIVETITVTVKINLGSWLTSDATRLLTRAILEAWRRNSKDPILLSALTDLLSAMAASLAPGTYSTLVGEAFPPLVAIIIDPAESSGQVWLASSALELIVSVLEGGEKGNLGEGFVAALAPPLFECLTRTQDRDVIVKGTECLTLIVRKGCDQLLAWHDNTNRTGLQVLLVFIARLLSPEENEASGLLIGDLIIHLLRNAGDAVLEVLPDLLRAMALRLTTADSATFIQSLIIPFAYLINSQRDIVLSLLKSIDNIPGPSTNGLEVFTRTWVDNAEMFVGFWPTRVSTLALCHMFLSTDERLRALEVKGEQVVDPATRDIVMTRSKTRNSLHLALVPTQYESVPFHVKALKILLHELQNTAEAEKPKVEDAQSDDGDEEWADDDIFQSIKQEEYRFLSDFADEGKEDLEDVVDEDLREDPISQVDLRGHLLQFIRQCASGNPAEFRAIASRLTQDEAAVIQEIIA